MKILVVGGVGYIGSHMLKRFKETNYEIEILDNLSSGQKENAQNYKLYVCDLLDKQTVYKILLEQNYDLVMHFAASINVEESYKNPKKYQQNNVINTINLLECMKDLKINKFIFSSSAAVYGEPEHIPVTELHPFNPVNPYGDTKAEVENALKSYEESCDLKYMSLRYFNACGAHLDGSIGEMHKPETHLIPLVLQVASGRKKHIEIFGDDYPTQDGTCVRDYVHVMDIVEAHMLAMENLVNTNKSQVFNIGNSKGFSVKQIIQMTKEITKVDIPVKILARRKGDPAQLIADNKKITNILNWNPKYSDLETIVKTAWNWEKKLKIQ